MPLLQRHGRRDGTLPWKRLWSPRGGTVDTDQSGFLAERQVAKYWSRNANLYTLDELDASKCILALGDPALGKSWELGNYASRVKARIEAAVANNASDGDSPLFLAFDATEFDSVEILQARIFDPLEAWKTGVGLAYVLIDSLDEAMISLDTICHALLDRLEFLPVDRLRLRIACRTAVLPDHFRLGLRRLFQGVKKAGGNVTRAGDPNALLGKRADETDSGKAPNPHAVIVASQDTPALSENLGYSEVEIAVLTYADAHIAASDRLGSNEEADKFLLAIRQVDAESFAARPQQLFALIGRYANNEPLNTSQEGLFRSLCLSLVDPKPVQSSDTNLRKPLTNREERYRIASRICAAMLFGNRPTIQLGSVRSGRQTALDITSIVGTERFGEMPFRISESELWEAVNTGLFTASSEDSGLATHLTFAEFLAADWVASTIRPLAQITSLLTDPSDIDKRILPQLRQVAAWLAAMRQDVFDAVALNEPDIMLWSDVVQLPASRRPHLVDALLRGTTKNTILNPPFGRRDRLSKLNHPGLGKQLAPIVADKAAPTRTRELALDIAWSNQVGALSSVGVAIALDSSESIEFRESAAELVGVAGSDTDRRLLIPLTHSALKDDDADQLKGAALRATWTLLEPTQLFQTLKRPKRPNFSGTYAIALREIAEKLDEAYTSAGALWLEKSQDGDGTTLEAITHSVLRLALRASHQPDVLSALATYANSRFKQHESLFHGHHSLEYPEDLGQIVAQDHELRRRWVKALVNSDSTNTREYFYFIHSSPQLFSSDDVAWGVVELVKLSPDDSRRNAWSELVRWAFNYERENLSAVVSHRSDPTLSQLFPDLVKHENVDEAVRDVATKQRQRHRELARAERRREATAAKRVLAHKPVESGSLPARLADRLKDALDPEKAWIRVSVEILRVNSRQWAFSLDQDRLTQLRALRVEPKGSQAVAAAASYLMVARPSEEPFPNGSSTYEVIFGFLAAVTLLEIDPGRFEIQNEAIWAKWMRVLVGHFADGCEEPLKAAILKQAAEKAPDAARVEFVRSIDGDASNRRGWVRDSILDIALQVPEVAEDLARLIAQGRYSAESTENLLEQLLKRNCHAAEGAALELFRRPVVSSQDSTGASTSHADSQRRRLAAGSALFFLRPSSAWAEVWSFVSNDLEIAKEFFGFAARNRDFFEASALNSLGPTRIADLYLLLARIYPPESDPWHTGVYSPGARENAQHLRNSLLNILEAQKTLESVSELERIARTEPVRDYLVQLWLRSRSELNSDRWLGTMPQDLIKIAERNDLRIVESSSQLLDVVCESLKKLQDELQGEWRSVSSLWNEGKEGSYPKPEEHLSNEVARHLRRDLSDRGVAIGRELRIQIPVQGGASGLRTDIDIQAPYVGQGVHGKQIPRVIIEVKGSWNPELMSAMRTQLVETYLDPHKVEAGLFLVGFYTCKPWIRTRQHRQSLRCGSMTNLKKQLEQQAGELTNAIREVRAIVLDASLPETASKQ